ncbi:serine/threonine-protein kinase [Actinophytocola oryzae]|uniref:serine/threonine-protein kinase n=1 Tax=Actinophytocola oryzae TaxID=502181 RepID=UPI003C7E1D2E
MSSTGERVVAGRYRLRRRLGQGAMGTVWEAFDEWLRRPVAVKEVLLPPGMPEVQAAELRERTLREARAIAALSHPNVITLHDVAREDGEPFVVMEFVHAHSLAAIIDVLGPLPTPKAAAIADAVAAGLAAAHQVGITHRDVKPGNVLIGVDGRVKLTDFGIARNVAERTLTSTGIMLGSPAYIAPEVAAGREVTSAADLWSLGATLFAVVEGRPPYDVNGAVLATVNQVVHGDVPRADTGGPMDDIVAALMVKEPGERISLHDLRDRLHPLLPSQHTPLLSEEELARVHAAVEAASAPREGTTTGEPEQDVPSAPPLAADPGPIPDSTPLAGDPGPLPGGDAPAEKTGEPPALAPAPGPLPFEPPSGGPRTRARGALATGVVAFLAVLLFFGAAGGGFALSRYVADKPLLPPSKEAVRTSTSSPPSSGLPDAMSTRSGNAATVKGEQGGGFTLPVPRDWVEFVEQIGDPDFVNSTRVYYLSPDGTQLLTVERLAGFYPKHQIAEYVDRLTARRPDVTVSGVGKVEIPGLATNGVTPQEGALELTYRATTNAKVVAPNDPAALDQNRVTYAHLLPFAGDLWVVSVTVPIEQEDSGSRLFDRIAPEFRVTG